MFYILVVLFVLVVSVQCNFNCNSCKCKSLQGSFTSTTADCSKLSYTLKVLESKDIQVGVNIVNLCLNSVPFKILPEYVFAKANVGKLKELELNSCGIETIHKDAFKNLTELKLLNVAYNKVSYLSVGTFQDNWNLKELYFGGNKLEVLEDGLLATLPFLEKVSFTNNRIKQIGNTFFVPTFNLKEILLSINLLSYINGTMLKQLRRLERLSVANNPWKCDCKLRKFQEMSLQYIQAKSPDCNNTNNPERLRGRHWDSLTDEDMTCDPVITLSNITDLDSSPKVTLECKVTANPKPIITFYKINDNSKNDVSMQNLNLYTFIYKYEIKDINNEINSTYICCAQNSLGITNKTIRINEIYLKYIGSKMKPITICPKIGGNVTLECTRFTYRKTNIKWFFQNDTIIENNNYEIQTIDSGQNGTKSILIIRNIQSTNYGQYRCSNALGNDEQYFEILSKEESSSLTSTMILFIALLIIVVIFTIGLLVFKCRIRQQNELSIKSRNEAAKRVTNDYGENRNEVMEESCIYVSSDNNIYEDIK